ncbi:MAG TPA: hypothetical protein VHG30_19315 [Microvirga sp.]|nr:hypothetical protein [Microvirga sp.]
MHELTLQPIRVRIDGGSQEGRLVFADSALVAVFVRVSPEEIAGDDQPRDGWFLEAGFGPCGSLATVAPPVFGSLDEAQVWVRARLAAGITPAAGSV